MTKTTFLPIFAVIALLASALNPAQWLRAQAVDRTKKTPPSNKITAGSLFTGMSCAGMFKTHAMSTSE